MARILKMDALLVLLERSNSNMFEKVTKLRFLMFWPTVRTHSWCLYLYVENHRTANKSGTYRLTGLQCGYTQGTVCYQFLTSNIANSQGKWRSQLLAVD